ncbi:uncharacterized protein LOC115477858 isoform X2 [Microcaecilia unicolor]|uniref:Uncharacterized protein LOC115477858 isoform X2 n=1 Tax=Microcaecilia unicolor TaxID=1415580 RepID=A0A6P7Z537_9AMPH|nr:uncharacterized protein LOC115477858 isoform X2 [Microcaecilia unicolor]
MAAYHCCVPFCTSDSRYNADKKLSFHRIPAFHSEPLRHNEWLKRIRRDPGPLFKVGACTRVCSKHFLPTDFVRTLTGRRNLKPNCIPSVFLWSKDAALLQPSLLFPSRRKLGKNKNSFESIMPVSQTQVQKTEQLKLPLWSSSSLDHCYDISPTSESEMLDAARKEITRLQQQTEVLEGKLFFLERFSNDSSLIHFYTGFKDYATLKALFLSLKPTTLNMKKWKECQENGYNSVKADEDLGEESLALIDQFFLFLCKVRQGFLEQDLAVRFNVSQCTVIRVVITWANYLHFMLAPSLQWPSREDIDKDMPACFQATYPHTRLILDCIEIKVQTESQNILHSRAHIYSSYTSFKGLLAISPLGSVIFLSPLYNGCISDKTIITLSGILSLLEPNDVVIADKNFPIQDLLASVGAHLVTVPFHAMKTALEDLTYTMEDIQSVSENEVPVAVEEVAVVMEEVPLAVEEVAVVMEEVPVAVEEVAVVMEHASLGLEEVAVVMQEVLVPKETGSVFKEELQENEKQTQLNMEEVPQPKDEDSAVVEEVPSALKAPIAVKVVLNPREKAEEQHPAVVQEIVEKNETASLRIHVRCAVGKVRTYHIFDKVIPLTLASIADQLWAVCALLNNCNGSLS